MVVVERERLEGLRRAGRLVGLDVGKARMGPGPAGENVLLT
jgi:hypothetical protein